MCRRVCVGIRTIFYLGIARQPSTNYVDWELLFSDPQVTASQTRGSMHRSPSLMEFQELMKNDAKSALKLELNKLVNSAPAEGQKV